MEENDMKKMIIIAGLVLVQCTANASLATTMRAVARAGAEIGARIRPTTRNYTPGKPINWESLADKVELVRAASDNSLNVERVLRLESELLRRTLKMNSEIFTLNSELNSKTSKIEALLKELNGKDTALENLRLQQNRKSLLLGLGFFSTGLYTLNDLNEKFKDWLKSRQP